MQTFTIEQQHVIAAAIRSFFDLHSMDLHPREHAKDATNAILTTLTAEADLEAIGKEVGEFAFYTRWMTDFIAAIGSDDILRSAGIREAHLLSPAMTVEPAVAA